MSTRNASIKLTLDSGSFTSSLKSLTGVASTIGRSMGTALSVPLSAGMNVAKRSLTEFGSSLKSTIKHYGTLASAVAVGFATDKALKYNTALRNLAYEFGKTTGRAIDWRDIQKDIDEIESKTGQDAENLVAAYREVYRATGDMEYAKSTLEAIGAAATLGGQETVAFANAAQLMFRKFHITAAEVPDTLAMIAQLTGAGGLQLEEMSDRFGQLATEAEAAGMKGQAGFRDLVLLFERFNPKFGEKLTQPLIQMMQKMKEGTAFAKLLEKRGIHFKIDATFMDKVKQVIALPHERNIRSTVIAKLGPIPREIIETLAEPFDKAMAEAKDKGMSKAEALKFAMAAFDKSVSSASGNLWDYSKLQRDTNERMGDDPAIKLRMAIDRVTDAFQQPKMIDAINKLADKLPMLADKVADIVNYVVENPKKSLAIGVGARFLGPAAGAALGAGGVMMLKKLGTGLKGGGITVAKSAIEAAKVGAGAIGGFGSGAAATTAGGALTTFPTAPTATAAGAGLLGAGAVLASAAGGAVAGYIGYKYGIEPALDSWSKGMRSADEALVDATSQIVSSKPSLEKAKAALEQIRKAKVEAEPGMIVSGIEKISGFFGADTTSTEKQRVERAKQLNEAEKALLTILKKLSEGANTASTALEKVGDAAAPVPGSVGKPGTSRGVRRPAHNAPGVAPGPGSG